MIRHLSVRHKFTAISVLTTTIVVLIASTVFVALEINNYRRALVQELTAIAQITSSNSTAAILFGDRPAARETLAALKARPNIDGATIFTLDGRLFAHHANRPGFTDRKDALDSVWPWDPDLPAGDVPQKYLVGVSAGDEPSFKIVWSRQSVDVYGPVRFDGDIIGGLFRRHSIPGFKSNWPKPGIGSAMPRVRRANQ